MYLLEILMFQDMHIGIDALFSPKRKHCIIQC